MINKNIHVCFNFNIQKYILKTFGLRGLRSGRDLEIEINKRYDQNNDNQK